MSVVGRPEVLFIGGCSGVGKSTVTAELHAQLAAAGVRHAVIEGDYLDLAWPAPHQQGLRLAQDNLRTIWRTYLTAGYRRLIYTNTLSVRNDVLADLLDVLGGDLDARGVLLTAERSTIASRLKRRERGTALRGHLERSARSAAELATMTAPSVARIDTTAKTVEAVAREIIAEVGWTSETPV